MKLYEQAFVMNEARRAFRARCAEINDDDRLSTEYKKKLIQQEREDLMKRLHEYGDAAVEYLGKITEEARKDAPRVDFRDPELHNALALLSMTKEKTPEGVIDQIFEQYGNNKAALRCFTPFFEDYKLHDAAMRADEIMKTPSRIETLENIEDMVYYGSNREDDFTLDQLKQMQAVDP